MNATLSAVLTLAPELLRALAAAVGVPALGPVLDTVLTTGAALIEAGDAGVGELQALTAHVKAMVSAGTDPTQDDWDALQARSDAAHALIQKAPAS